MKKERMGKLHLLAIIAFVVFILLGIASMATTPTIPIELGTNYREMLMPHVGNERVIDTVTVRGSTASVCRDPQHAITSQQALGATYQVREDRGSERHRHEPIFEQLVNGANRAYPSETVAIRSARASGHVPTNARQEEYYESQRGSDGRYYSVTRVRTLYDCYIYYVGNIVTTEPMPQLVTHRENFTMPRMTRADIYRRTINWLEDNTERRRITIEQQDMERGRIRGTVTSAARADQTYIVTSNYTIDIYDEEVVFDFGNTILRRTDPSLQRVGNPEQIFLQSIADATMTELVDFATSIRSYILSR